MKAIKSKTDIEALQIAGYNEKVIVHINDYFTRLMGVYGEDYDSSEGFIILLEKGDPINDKNFLENELCIRGGEDLVSIIKEFIDYIEEINFYIVLYILSAGFAMSYIIPGEEEWFGKELLEQLQTFQNYQESAATNEP